ncbi:hypothetical protein IFM89_024691 [Coptis chinensis]|uniref:Uncharacterized protein n=1 Tax=Coptis chinensis TaxID=261450 RepID=A0A835IY93_9MAGN|nr:hypothetical protein IFM89_024691 [Coptis chinensis]
MAANLIPRPSPPPHSLFFHSHHCTITRRWSYISLPLSKAKDKRTSLCFTPSATSLSEEVPNQAGMTSEDEFKLPTRGCKSCGREEMERGCNGEGRIQGGIATVPGFGWWPIKAYRPCPGFVESGGRYRRRGQSMDEVAWGRSGREAASVDEVQSSFLKKCLASAEDSVSLLSLLYYLTYLEPDIRNSAL